MQTIRGLEAVPQFYSDVALTCGATRTWTLWHVKLRVAARQIYGGIRVSAAYIFATAATAEYLGARKGLGIWLQAAYNSFRTPLIFSATLVIIVITGVIDDIVSLRAWTKFLIQILAAVIAVLHGVVITVVSIAVMPGLSLIHI